MQLKNKVSHDLFSQVEEETDIDKLESSDEIIKRIKIILEKLRERAGEKKETVEKIDVLAVVAHRTGIPLGKVQKSEQERLLNMEDWLRRRVVGQDHALKSISEAILE